MIALAYLCAAGVIQFADFPLPGLDIGSSSFPEAAATTNVCVADIDEDGSPDLVLPSGLWLQRAGRFSRSAFVPMPDSLRIQALRAETGRLYIYAEGRRLCFSLLGQRWIEEWRADLPAGRVSTDNVQPLFHDVDGDGHAEMILPLEDRLLVFAVSAPGPLIAELGVYPPRRPQLVHANNLWASRSRPPEIPMESRDFRINFEGPVLTTRETLRTGDRQVEFRFNAYRIEQDPAGTFSSRPTEAWASGPFADVLSPYRRSEDGRFAFAGARPARSGSLRLGESLTEVLLKGSGGASMQTLRTKSPLPFLALADFDGDGDEDLLTQANTLGSGPPREVFMRVASAHAVDHEFFVHVQDTDGKFDAQPRRTFGIAIDLGTSALEEGPRWHAYRRGALSCASADFNGDRRADIAAWTAAGRLRVWINHEGVFPKQADAELSVAPGAGFAAADVDRDGRADLVVLPEAASAGPPVVWFSR